MTRKKLYALLAAESAFIILLDALTVSVPDSFTSIWNFPFEQIGAGLLALHDLGSVGAGMACALWIGLSFLLAVPAVCGRGKTPWERALLILFAASVCVTLYVMMNPIKLMTPYDETGSFVKLIFSMMTCSTLIATAALSAGFNVLQVLFLDSLSHVVTTMQIPVFSIAFTLFALLFTRIVVENRDLRDDNELFI